MEEEADESEYWFELLECLGSSKNPEVARLKDEAHQLVAIMIQSKKTARGHPALPGPEHSQFAIRNS